MSFSILEVNEAIGIFAGALRGGQNPRRNQLLEPVAHCLQVYGIQHVLFMVLVSWAHHPESEAMRRASGISLRKSRRVREGSNGFQIRFRWLCHPHSLFARLLCVHIHEKMVAGQTMGEKKWKIRVPKRLKKLDFRGYDFGVGERLNRLGIGESMFSLFPAPYWVMNSFVSLVFGILTMELEIRWNNFESINTLSSGEIIPLVIGCFSLFMSLALLFGVRDENPGEIAKKTEDGEHVEQEETEAEEGSREIGEEHA
jgi:hypothetical protein